MFTIESHSGFFLNTILCKFKCMVTFHTDKEHKLQSLWCGCWWNMDSVCVNKVKRRQTIQCSPIYSLTICLKDEKGITLF